MKGSTHQLLARLGLHPFLWASTDPSWPFEGSSPGSCLTAFCFDMSASIYHFGLYAGHQRVQDSARLLSVGLRLLNAFGVIYVNLATCLLRPIWYP